MSPSIENRRKRFVEALAASMRRRFGAAQAS
jgi:hypothetical protein